MILFRISILFALISNLAYSQAEYPVVPADLLFQEPKPADLVKNNIQKKSFQKFTLVNGAVSTEQYTDFEIKYNHKGQCVEQLQLGPKGSVKSIFIFDYKDEQSVSKISEFLPEGELQSYKSFKYSDEGFLWKILRFNQYGYIISITEFEVNQDENSVTEKLFFSPDSVVETRLYKYTCLDTGRVISEVFVHSNPNLNYKKSLFYKDNKLHKEEFYNEAGKISYSLNYLYSPLGRLIEVNRVFPDGNKTKKFIYHYNQIGLRSGRVEYNRRGSIISYYKFTYN